MFRVRPRSDFRLIAASFLVCACANVIGIAGYEVDPALHERSSSSGGERAAPSNGTDEKGGQGGQDISLARAGAEHGGSWSAGGEAGLGGKPAAGGRRGVGNGCRVKEDCDDEISCTVDSCDASGNCSHQPRTALCEPDADECLTCKVGIGCVAGVLSVKELLLDNDFDDKTGNWEEYSETYPNIIGYDQYADTGSYTAQFGPAAFDATAQEYADLLQYVTVPPNTLRLTFSGFYELLPGGLPVDAEDYVVAALFDTASGKNICQFHSWAGNSGEHLDWWGFTYDAPKHQLTNALGKKVTFDLVGYVWDSFYSFDSLSLQATTCEDG